MPVTPGYRQGNCPVLWGIPCVKKSVVNTYPFLDFVKNVAMVQTGWRLPRAEDCLARAFLGVETDMHHPCTMPVDSLIGNVAEESWEGATGWGLGSSSYHQEKFGANPRPLLWYWIRCRCRVLSFHVRKFCMQKKSALVLPQKIILEGNLKVYIWLCDYLIWCPRTWHGAWN